MFVCFAIRCLPGGVVRPHPDSFTNIHTRIRHNHTHIYINIHKTLSQVYRIVVFDQRGCGQSTPHACLEENTYVRSFIFHICIYVEEICSIIYTYICVCLCNPNTSHSLAHNTTKCTYKIGRGAWSLTHPLTYTLSITATTTTLHPNDPNRQTKPNTGNHHRNYST